MPWNGTPSSTISSSSDEDSSSDEESLHSDDSEVKHVRAVQRIASLYRSAIPREPSQASIHAGLHKKLGLKLSRAILDGRAALLERRWAELLKAIKQIDACTSQVNSDTALEWRKQIISRLMAEALFTVTQAMVHKRDLPSDDAKCLSITKQLLTKIVRKETRVTALDCKQAEDRQPTETACLDSIELFMLQTPSQDQPQLCLEGLGLTNERFLELLTSFARLLLPYQPFEDAELEPSLFRVLRMTDNEIFSIPSCLPDLFPHLTELYFEGNELHCLPPTMMRLRNLQRISYDQGRIKPSNVSKLLDQLHTQQVVQFETVPSLASLSLDKIQQSEQFDTFNIPPHLNWSPQSKPYTCASCKQRIFAEDARYLSSIPLRENVYHFDPPLTIANLAFTKQQKPITQRTKHIISSKDWTFCRVCLPKHCYKQTFSAHDGVSRCACLVCEEEREAPFDDDEPSLRWARYRIDPPNKK